jgi:hypothetical protein
MARDSDRNGGTDRRLLTLIIVTYALAATLVVVESYRSWGVGRPILTVADDFAGAALLAWAAWLTGRPGERARRIVVAVWGVICGVSLCNFSVKLLMPDRMTPGNLPPAMLQTLVGLAFLVAFASLAASVLLPRANPKAGSE